MFSKKTLPNAPKLLSTDYAKSNRTCMRCTMRMSFLRRLPVKPTTCSTSTSQTNKSHTAKRKRCQIDNRHVPEIHHENFLSAPPPRRNHDIHYITTHSAAKPPLQQYSNVQPVMFSKQTLPDAPRLQSTDYAKSSHTCMRCTMRLFFSTPPSRQTNHRQYNNVANQQEPYCEKTALPN